MRHATKFTTLLASFGIAAVALTGCAGGASKPASPENTVSVAAPTAEAANESSFENNVLTTPDLTIKITDVKTIAAGEPGNEYGKVPVIAFWYDITNTGDEEVSPMNWLFLMTAYQDNDPNIENKLGVGSLPDQQFLDSQTAKIKKGGTVSNAVAYELSDTTTPVKLVASDSLGMGDDIGSMTFELN
ncbi:DUF5067 domain-containing protein (plasmid) [Humibacter sp. BT305]|nr:DUF5067 domain-containing protein [Humibacter sp. BT305]